MASSNIAENITAFKQKDRTQKTWTGGSNTFTVTDPHVKASSQVWFHHNSAFAGNWYVSSITEGTSFVITSTNAETTNPTFYYTLY